jgi:hypothetical protein
MHKFGHGLLQGNPPSRETAPSPGRTGRGLPSTPMDRAASTQTFRSRAHRQRRCRSWRQRPRACARSKRIRLAARVACRLMPVVPLRIGTQLPEVERDVAGRRCTRSRWRPRSAASTRCGSATTCSTAAAAGGSGRVGFANSISLENQLDVPGQPSLRTLRPQETIFTGAVGFGRRRVSRSTEVPGLTC